MYHIGSKSKMVRIVRRPMKMLRQMTVSCPRLGSLNSFSRQ